MSLCASVPLCLFFLRSLSSTLLLRAPYPSKIRLTRCIMESYMYVQAGYIALKIIIIVRDVHLIITGSPQGVLDYRSRESFALCALPLLPLSLCPSVPLCLCPLFLLPLPLCASVPCLYCLCASVPCFCPCLSADRHLCLAVRRGFI